MIKVVLYGPESTGKTTLAEQLAEHYRTQWVPEFMRDYLQKKWDSEKKLVEKKDLIPIAKGQLQL
ncbi:MAG: ATP-binding protein, partial [Aequorivita sp.]|nr:ATP-binding protein [Aequorivita sp.]